MKKYFIFFNILILLLFTTNVNCQEVSLSGTVNLKKIDGTNVYYLNTVDGKDIYLGVDENINSDEKKCVISSLNTHKIITIEGELLSDSSGYYFYENDFYCKSGNTEGIKGLIKNTRFKFIDCEGGIGGAMHITVSDLKTGENYLMTAYKDTPCDICNLQSGTIVKIAYKVEEGRDAFTYIGISE